MQIHFVCEGNTFRSRLADAYFNSKKIPEWKATSSGILPTTNMNGPISWVAELVLKEAGIVSFLSNTTWVETTREILNASDFVVFMKREYYTYCRENFEFTKENYEIWDIPDIGDAEMMNPARILEVTQIAQETLHTLSEKIDLLIKNRLSNI